MYAENELIARIRRRFGDIASGGTIGDDAAIVDLTSGRALLCSDLLAEGTHFRRPTHPPESVGFKAVAANVSDVGAMGGSPLYCLLSLAVPADLDPAWVDRLLDGVERACSDFDVRLVGGDSAAAERIFVDVSMVGRAPAGDVVLRGGARAGDGIWVTGTLGGSARGLARLESGERDHPSIERHLYPRPRHRVGALLASAATAMIDVSDGFGRDLQHVLEASGVSARVEADAIPCDPDADLETALASGEEYELIVTGGEVPGELDGVPLTRVGEIVPPGKEGPRVRLVGSGGERVLEPGGWQHFG